MLATFFANLLCSTLFGHITSAMSTKTIICVTSAGALLSAALVYLLVLAGFTVVLSIATIYAVSFVCLLGMQRSAGRTCDAAEVQMRAGSRRSQESRPPVAQSILSGERASARDFFDEPGSQVTLDTA